jgi:hypothetical protein
MDFTYVVTKKNRYFLDCHVGYLCNVFIKYHFLLQAESLHAARRKKVFHTHVVYIIFCAIIVQNTIMRIFLN